MENMGAVMGEKPTKQRVILVLILLVTLLIAYLDRVNVSVLLADNTFLSDMGIKGQPVQMGLLMTLFLIAYGISNVFLSPIGDYLGPRKAMCLSIFLWCLSLFIGGIAAYQFVWDLGDVGVGLMTIFNMIALFPLAPKALQALTDYEHSHKR